MYAQNWSAKTHEQLISRIKRCAKDFPQETIQKMFENLPNKIYKAAESGLESLN